MKKNKLPIFFLLLTIGLTGYSQMSQSSASQLAMVTDLCYTESMIQSINVVAELN
ncbi:MAG: hypothetical protein ACJATI_003099 [Halioglobus sp.]|jgi:hypothetical protein